MQVIRKLAVPTVLPNIPTVIVMRPGPPTWLHIEPSRHDAWSSLVQWPNILVSTRPSRRPRAPPTQLPALTVTKVGALSTKMGLHRSRGRDIV